MEAQVAQFLNRGMNQDISVSKASNEFAFRNHNIRITAVNDKTLLSVTNEKGPLKMTISIVYKDELWDSIKGEYLGYSIIEDYLVLFTTDAENDYIYLLKFNEDIIEGEVKFRGNLNFSTDNPIEALSYYENDNVQKVYWVDGNNPPRFINIKDQLTLDKDSSQFEFTPELKKFPTVNIEKNYSGGGLFPSGVIQYFISYYNKYGTETGIIWSSDLQYITQYNKGISPEGTVSCNFTININNIDTSYDYIRVYSIIRTSKNSTPISKIVTDINISNRDSVSFTDVNDAGESIEPTSLLFLGGSKFIASTLNQKDDTIFFGDIKMDSFYVSDDIINYINNKISGLETDSPFISFYYKSIPNEDFQLKNSSRVIKTFKAGELYRFAIQLQDKTGYWTSPIWVGDKKCSLYPKNTSNLNIEVANAEFTLDNNLFELLKDSYVNYRLLMVEPTFSNRRVIAQGVVTPTVFNYSERVDKTGPYSIASWIMRPVKGRAQYKHLGGLGNIVKYSEEEQKDIFYNTPTGEIQNSIENPPIGSGLTNNYYVDTSIVSMYSPDIEDNASILSENTLKFRIVGIIPITSTDSDGIIETSTPGIKADAGFYKNFSRISSRGGSAVDAFIKGELYKDYGWTSEGKLDKGNAVNYIVYLWGKKGSIIGQTAESVNNDGSQFNTLYADLKHKIIANKRNSSYSKYFNNSLSYNVIPTIYNTDVIESKILKLANNSSVIYQGNYENLLTNRTKRVYNNNIERWEEKVLSYRVFWADYDNSGSPTTPQDRTVIRYSDIEQFDPVHIKYNTTPHITFELNSGGVNKTILPYLSSNGESAWSLQDTYGDDFQIADNYKLSWLDSTESYIQDSISDVTSDNKPYLFLGEVYRDIEDDKVYGGYSKEILESLSWIPISEATSIDRSIVLTEGDTYYQRWDCLVSYPSTNDDLNSVVDITSFMLETHINIEGRYDRNKEFLNILNARKDTYNKVNSAYSQSNNLMSYSILDKSDISEYNSIQILYSLSKNPNSYIDTWTTIPATSAFNLNGLYGKLNKIINFNDTLITFQDKAVSVINFNNRTALSTESGVPIEIANSGKVNGYTVISSSIGCKNKHSICQTSSGVYFIDDLNKSLFRFNKEGLSNLSATGMSQWFKNNLTEKEYLFYDAITHDVYVVNNSDCLVYNEDLQNFTSFMDYQGMNLLFNVKGSSWALKTEDILSLYEMFGGKYNTTFDSNEHKGYFVEYKINPEPITDKIFGNVEYIADCFEDANVDTVVFKEGDVVKYPFETLEVWNEYQRGITSIKDRFKYPNFEKKFRIWRVDIPRDESNGRDRIRNPWAYIRLSKPSIDNFKTVFHNLIVKYYK